MSAVDYFAALRTIFEKVEQTQLDAIRSAGRLGAAAVLGGGLIHVFGTGHSHLLAEELYYRAGGLLTVNAILEPSVMLHEGGAKSSAVERLPGMARAVIDQEPVRQGDLMIIASNSGRNAMPVEMALEAQARGARVVAVTSLAHSQGQTPNNPPGKKLYEVADVVIDNGGVPGDAVVVLPGLPVRACATSTAVGAAIVQAIVAEVIDGILAAGQVPPVIQSGNVEGSQAYNQRLVETYGDRAAPRLKLEWANRKGDSRG